MSECVNAETRDYLPDYVHGQLDAARAAEVRAHISGCGECASEVELLRLVVATAPDAPEIDVARIAAALPTPTRHGLLLHRGGVRTKEQTLAVPVAPVPAGRATGWARPGVRAAAAIAVVAAGGLSLLVGRDVLRPESQVGQATSVIRGASQNVAVAPAPIEAPVPRAGVQTPIAAPREVVVAGGSGLSLVGGMQELSDSHLVTLLGDLERMDALPAAEPESLVPAVGGGVGSEGGDQ